MDVFRNRVVEKEIHAHPLRKQYYEKRDDSDKLKLDTIEDVYKRQRTSRAPRG